MALQQPQQDHPELQCSEQRCFVMSPVSSQPASSHTAELSDGSSFQHPPCFAQDGVPLVLDGLNHEEGRP